MDTLPVPDSYAEAVKHYEDDGYTVEGLCPECQWGLIVSGTRTFKFGRFKGQSYDVHSCTAYGSCEYAPG